PSTWAVQRRTAASRAAPRRSRSRSSADRGAGIEGLLQELHEAVRLAGAHGPELEAHSPGLRPADDGVDLALLLETRQADEHADLRAVRQGRRGLEVHPPDAEVPAEAVDAGPVGGLERDGRVDRLPRVLAVLGHVASSKGARRCAPDRWGRPALRAGSLGAPGAGGRIAGAGRMVYDG